MTFSTNRGIKRIMSPIYLVKSLDYNENSNPTEDEITQLRDGKHSIQLDHATVVINVEGEKVRIQVEESTGDLEYVHLSEHELSELKEMSITEAVFAPGIDEEVVFGEHGNGEISIKRIEEHKHSPSKERM